MYSYYRWRNRRPQICDKMLYSVVNRHPMPARPRPLQYVTSGPTHDNVHDACATPWRPVDRPGMCVDQLPLGIKYARQCGDVGGSIPGSGLNVGHAFWCHFSRVTLRRAQSKRSTIAHKNIIPNDAKSPTRAAAVRLSERTQPWSRKPLYNSALNRKLEAK